MRQQGVTDVTAVGPDASYMAMKSIVIANKYLQAPPAGSNEPRQETFKGKVLAVTPEKHEFGSKEEGTLTVGLKLHVQALPDIHFNTEVEIFSSKTVNVGLMGGLIANRLQASEVVTVGGMGAGAISSALKATMIAQRYMAETLGSDRVLALVPKFHEFEEADEQRMRMILGCIRVPK